MGQPGRGPLAIGDPWSAGLQQCSSHWRSSDELSDSGDSHFPGSPTGTDSLRTRKKGKEKKQKKKKEKEKKKRDIGYILETIERQ